MKKIISISKLLIEKLNKNNIDEHTAHCAYFTLLAFIPFIMLILTLTKYIGIDEQSLFQVIDKLAPSNLLNGVIKCLLIKEPIGLPIFSSNIPPNFLGINSKANCT